MSSISPLRATLAQIKLLANYSSCELSDALLKIGIAHGGHIPDLEMLSRNSEPGGTIVGEAFTVQMVDTADKAAPKLTGHFVDLAPPGSIIIISTPPHIKSASFGGLLGTAASVKGVQGVVIDGKCRDLAELRTLNLPIFARGHSTLGQSPFTRPSTVQTPITIHPRLSTSSAPPSSTPVTPFPSITINAFDVILGDEDGVIAIRPENLDKVLELVENGRREDELCRVDILKGRGVAETFAEYRGGKK